MVATKTFNSWNKTVDMAKQDVDNLVRSFKSKQPQYDQVGEYATMYDSIRDEWWVCVTMRKEEK